MTSTGAPETSKRQARELGAARRAHIDANERTAQSVAVVASWDALLAALDHNRPRRSTVRWPPRNAPTVLMPVPFRDEVDTGPLARHLEHQGWVIARPRVARDAGGQGVMEAVACPLDQALGPGAYGIPEPPATMPALPAGAIDVVIVPGLLFDEMGGRVGYGAGYFDRFLRAEKRALRVGLGYREQLAPARIAQDDHDVAMDALILGNELVATCAAAG